jgi:hypothetical protein
MVSQAKEVNTKRKQKRRNAAILVGCMLKHREEKEKKNP